MQKKICIAIPNTGTVKTEFMAQMLGLNYGNYSITYDLLKASLIYISRERLACSALKRNDDYLLFLDSDQIVPRDIVPRMAKFLENGEDIVTGLAFLKEPPYSPCVYKSSEVLENGQISLKYYDVNEIDNTPFYVPNCGSGVVMMKTDIFRKVPQPWFCMPNYMSGEDVSFFHKLTTEYDYKILCDPSLQIGHWGWRNVDRFTHLEYKQNQKKLMDGDVL